MKKQKISYELYNPQESVKENADRMQCSEASIRRYIKVAGLDRNYDSKFARWKRVQDMERKHPEYSIKKRSEILGLSYRTYTTYRDMSKEEIRNAKVDNNKISKFSVGNKSQCVKSVSDSQHEILAWILALYCGGKTFDCDLTASELKFYKRIPTPKLLFDKHPQSDSILPLEVSDSIPYHTLSSVIYDLPYIISVDKYHAKMGERFSYFESMDELFDTNISMLERAHRLLKKGGILAVKTMDTSLSIKQIWVSDFVLNEAKNRGFELLDKFILTANTRLLATGTKQHMARKFHSYFFVFKRL